MAEKGEKEEPTTCLYCGDMVYPRQTPACTLVCDNAVCGYSIYHKDCIEHHLRKCNWKTQTGAKTGLAAFPCPKGKGKLLEGVTPCRFKISHTRDIPILSTKGELRKAARIAQFQQQAQAMAQKQPPAAKAQKQPQPANPGAKAAPPAHKFPLPPPQRQPVTPRVLVAAAPQQPRAEQAEQQLRLAPQQQQRAAGGIQALISPAEQREVPGMEFEAARKPQRRRANKAAAAADAPQQPGLQPDVLPTPDSEPAAPNAWVSSLDVYNRLIAGMAGGGAEGGDGGGVEHAADGDMQQQPVDAEDSGEWECWEQQGMGGDVDPMAGIVDILPAFGVSVKLAPRGSAARGACLHELLAAFDALAEQGYDVEELKAVVEAEVRVECFDTDFFDAAAWPASGGAVAEEGPPSSCQPSWQPPTSFSAQQQQELHESPDVSVQLPRCIEEEEDVDVEDLLALCLPVKA